ncbi:MAG: bifunctional 4-hydroxy-2-oxoglutarate aldolase/2-dehydro-3-deoxy-phosphogluconate aldolase [Deferribacteraceae bacterium]|jgi:2-dehydro-3-deoxyphosphogluconate aldolase/(4S)-4-hydroxy-2-oxoglutarate aldolase|nr:bifunctional 4-hydroxy-2-oxoglutarate aldolase/2-dehydro-3-deoxy-phosphogluconate aldolase [Deferribacteraceae bacterium]
MEKKVYELGVLPVIKIEDAANAKPLAKALIDGDLPAAEVTFRTKAAKDAIKAISQEFPEMLVGAGTVLTTAQVDDSIAAGAKFIISPGLNPKIVEYCKSKNVPIFPGVNNPSQIEQAIELGLKVVKFFPAEQSGGLNMLKAMAAPYGDMKFMPTGGINAGNIEKYLDFKKIIACGGSWMVPENLIDAKDFAGITKLTKEAIQTVIGFKFAHLGINNPDEAAGSKCLDTLSLFGERVAIEVPVSYFTQNYEILKKDSRGAKGHIAYVVNNIDRALAYLKRKGINIIEDSAKKDEKGNITFTYLDMEISGFAVHIKQK